MLSLRSSILHPRERIWSLAIFAMRKVSLPFRQAPDAPNAPSQFSAAQSSRKGPGVHRFILLFSGSASRFARDLARLRAAPALHVIDHSASLQSVLVEADERDVRELLSSMRDWQWTPEHIFPLAGSNPG